MKIPRIVVYAALSFVVSSLLFFFFGSGGLLDYRGLFRYRATVEQNIDELKRENGRLLAEVQALGSDPERLTLKARELGYFREGEKVIRIAGQERGKDYYTVGRVLRRKAGRPHTDWVFRAIGLGLPVLFVLVSMSLRRRKNREAGNR
jgi:cell division protein FtsB